ncbi:MAG: pyridoxal-phosphate dependent enzyme [Firmicutes bacterium]|nr:pyridoxal-phosphate dependent enzyme [Bacillota bacterium]
MHDEPFTQRTGSGEPLWEPGIEDVLRARRRIAPYLAPTPLLRPPALARLLGAEVFLKCENLQPTGAFKVRGGVNLVAAEREAGKLGPAGLTAASTGNHGQSVAYAGHLFGLPVTVFGPEGLNPLKREAIRAWGAEVREVGRDFDAAREACEAYARETGARYVHSMNEPLLVAGVATAYLEALLEVPDADFLIVPVGGGSGASGAAIVARALRPGMRVIGVQAEGAPAVYRSFRSGRLESTPAAVTRAEGLATRVAFELPVRILRRYLDEMVLVGDQAMLEAMRILAETAHLVAEEAGAAPLAAALALREELRGKKVILPVTGGNATAGQLAAALAG